jgi:hypothetical protein
MANGTTRQRPPAGGIWERDRLFGGERLADAYEPDQPFVLIDLEVVGQIEVDKTDADKKADKTELQTFDLNSGELRLIGTLSGPIADMARMDRSPDDLPAVVCWESVPSDRGNDANVLRYVRPLTDGERQQLDDAQAGTTPLD